jgi:protein-S-isoprenylcysteine O-methyltransferase Ste14
MDLRPLPFSGEPVFALVFWSAFAGWVVPEIIASKTKRAVDSANARDRGSLYLIVALWWAGIAADFSLSLLVPQAAITWQRVAFFFAGIFLMILGTAFRWYCVRVLGKYFTFDVTTHSGQILIEVGPYRYIRHPSYSGALVTLLGFGLALGNWAGLAAVLLCMGLAYSYRIPVEEAALTAALGDAYKQYQERTWRLIPLVF